MSLPSSITPPIDLTRVFSLDVPKDRPLDRARLATLAQEFEAMLLLQMVRQMRQSLLMDDEQDAGLGNETMTETFDVEFARYLARAGGVGLARMIEANVKDPATAAAAPETAAPETVAPQSAAPESAIAQASQVSRTASTAVPRTAGQAETPGLTMPLEADATSKFGWRADPFHGRRKFHSGVDLRAAYGTDVPAAGAGTVRFAGERGGYGLMVIVEHETGLETRYAHLASASVTPGQTVGAGDLVGRVGSSGRSTAPHLHFEVLLDGQRLDPEQVAARRPGELAGLAGVLEPGQSTAP